MTYLMQNIIYQIKRDVAAILAQYIMKETRMPPA